MISDFPNKYVPEPNDPSRFSVSHEHVGLAVTVDIRHIDRIECPRETGPDDDLTGAKRAQAIGVLVPGYRVEGHRQHIQVSIAVEVSGPNRLSPLRVGSDDSPGRVVPGYFGRFCSRI